MRSRLRDDTLSRKASLNAVAAILDYSARMVVGFLISPLLVSKLGDVVYGVYQTLGRLVGFATPAGGRPSQALKWTIARQQHSTEYEEKRLQVGSALVVWLLFLPPLLIAGGLLAWFSPELLALDHDLHTEVRIAAGVLVADLILLNLLTIPQSVVQGENLGYKRMGLSTLVVIAGGGMAALAAELGAGLIGVTASVLATTVLTGLVFLRVARRHVSWFGVARPSWDVVRTFFKLSGWFLLWNLVIQLMRASDVVVLGIASSPQDVTVYALTRYVPEAIFGVVAITITAIMPGLGGVIGAGDMSRAAGVRSESMSVTWLLATAAGAAFIVLHEPFLTLWVGSEYDPGTLATLLIVVMTLQFAFIRNDSSIIDLTLELRSKVVLGFVSAAASIGLAVFFIRGLDLGIEGLALGFITGRAIVSVAYPWSVCRSLGLSVTGQLRGAARSLAFTALLFGAAVAAAPATDVDSWPALVPLAAATLTLAMALSFFIGLSATQRIRVSHRVRQIIGRA